LYVGSPYVHSIFTTQAETSSEKKIGIFSTKVDHFITKTTRIFLFAVYLQKFSLAEGMSCSVKRCSD